MPTPAMDSHQSARVGSMSPFFIVADLARATAFYRNRLGFEVTLAVPEPEPFFGIVNRDAAQLMLKEIGEGVDPLPNSARHQNARWDAFVFVDDPDALAAEVTDRGVVFSAALADTDDGLRGFEVTDPDGYVLFFGRPLH